MKDDQRNGRRFKLLAGDGTFYLSATPGVLGGNRAARIYGRLNCPSALRALAQADRYQRYRVFFGSEADAIAAGYRPCGRRMPGRYRAWKAQPIGAP